MNLANKFTTILDRIADALLIGLTTSVVSIVLLAVFFRYVLNHSLFWSDELVRYLFVWFTLIGASVTLREREHIRVEYFVEKLPLRMRRNVEIATLAGVCIFQAAMAVLGTLWVMSTQGTYTSALQWPLNLFFYAALPCSAVLGFWYTLRRLLRSEFSEKESIEEMEEEIGLSSSGRGTKWES